MNRSKYAKFKSAIRLAAFVLALSPAAGMASTTSDKVEEPIALRPEVTVDSSKILLKNVFSGVDRNADRVIASAPQPGHQMTLKATWLWRVAKIFGLDWRPHSRLDVAIVTRASRTVQPGSIRERLGDKVKALVDSGDTVKVDLDQNLMTLHLPSNSDGGFRIDNLRIDDARNRFSAVVRAPAAGPAHITQSIGGRIYRMVEVAVPSRRIMRGAVIKDDDITYVQMRRDKLPRNKLVSAREIIGKSARRALRTNQPIGANDIQPPVLVERNSIVTISLETNVMQLTAQGKAIEDGARNDVIRVANLKSGQVIEAVVSGFKKVTVAPFAQTVAQ